MIYRLLGVQSVIDRFKLRAKCEHQTYGLGLKEVWEVSVGGRKCEGKNC